MMLTNRVTDTVALKKMMIERGFDKICDLSDASGVSRNTLGAILRGVAQPSADVMDKLIKALGIPPGEAGEIFFASNLRGA